MPTVETPDGTTVSIGDIVVVALSTYGPLLGFVGRVVKIDDSPENPDDAWFEVDIDDPTVAGSFRQRVPVQRVASCDQVDGPLYEPYDWTAFENQPRPRVLDAEQLAQTQAKIDELIEYADAWIDEDHAIEVRAAILKALNIA